MQSDEGSLSSKKRNRTSTVSIACVSCRSKHIKCDGKSPCDNCKKKGIECSYQKTPVKRGPTSGTIIWLKKVVSGLTEELGKQTEASKQWQAKYDTLMQSVNKKSLPPGSLANTPIVPLEQLNAFVNSYMTRCFKYFRINPPISLTNDSVEDELKIGCVTAMAAYGAIAIGNESVGFDFANKARIIVSGKFDNVNPVVAATYFILSSLYAYRFDSEREYFFNENALAMTDRLLKKTRVKMLDGIDIEHLYQIAHLASLCYKYSDNPQPIAEFLKNLGVQRQDLLDFCLLNLLHKLYGGVFHILAANEANQIEFLYTRLAVLDSLESVVNSVGPEAEKFLLRIDTLRAFIHLVLSQDESADYRANRALSKFDKLPAPENGIMLVMMPLYLLAQIFMYRNQSEQMQQVLELLSNNIRTYSSLSSALEILLDHSPDLHDIPKNTQQNQNTIFGMNYVYPRIDTYRSNAVRWGSQMSMPPPSSQQLLPIKTELGANAKMPATPPYNTAGPIESIVISNRPTAPLQPKTQEGKNSAYRPTNPNAMVTSPSASNSPGSGNNTPSGNQNVPQLRAIPEHQVYGHQFNNNEYAPVSAQSGVVSNMVPLPPHQQPRRPNSSMAAPHMPQENSHFIPPEYYQMQQQQLANQQAASQRGMYSHSQTPHMVSAQQMNNNTNRMPMNTNPNMNTPSNMDHEYQQYYAQHPEAPVFPERNQNYPYMPQFHNNSFFPHNQHHGPGHGPSQGTQDLDQHPQSSEHFH